MTEKFKVEFLKEVFEFLDGIDEKARQKILFNIDKAKVKRDNTLFKKLTSDIWEFRTLYNKKQYRLFAFWDKTNNKVTFVIATHGIVKKTQKTPKKEIMKTYTLDEVKDKYLGKKGTKERDIYENELRLDLIGEAIKQARKERQLTQTQLGELIGVKKAQISKIENNLTDARFETILKVFKALNAKISFNVELLNHKVDLATE
ncbi:MAG: type II toxin-antitoxin system RelE/ParE family toxin [Flavobacteriaceae bacterium]